MGENTTKVRILLDMDGVLNAIWATPPRGVWPVWKQGEAHGFKIRWAPEVADFVRRLAETPGVEVMWLSTWAELANEHISPLLDLPRFKVLGQPPLFEQGWWKFEDAKALYEKDPVPFVWIDDDLGDAYDCGASSWVKSLEGKGLGIRPDHQKGLTQRLLDEIEVFVDGWLVPREDD
jgi:HAD domain in Swiss Army Knife RNA repair proteins